MKKLYMAVTPDKYELPMAVCDTVAELSKIFQIPISSIQPQITKDKAGTRQGVKFVRVEL